MRFRYPIPAVLAALTAVGAALAVVPTGKPAPSIAGTTMDGKKFNLADYKGKSGVLLNFYASW
jgi:hypothetical protein